MYYLGQRLAQFVTLPKQKRQGLTSNALEIRCYTNYAITPMCVYTVHNTVIVSFNSGLCCLRGIVYCDSFHDNNRFDYM